MIKQIVAWDLGATKCAAGLVEYDLESSTLTIKQRCTVKLSDTVSLEHLVSKIELGLGITMRDADAICIGAAGQYDGQILHHECAYPYVMNFADIAHQQRWSAYDIIHDYAPIVCATFTTYMKQPHNVKRLNTASTNPYGRRVALGVGTGLGLKDGVLFENGDFWLGKNEIGHIGIPTPPQIDRPYLQRHQELIKFLQQKAQQEKNQQVTFEKLLSGQGTVRLYEFFHPHAQKDMTPEQVHEQVMQGRAADVQATLAWYLGLLVGTVQLIFMPEGGVWLTGGVALHHIKIFDHDEFYAGIAASPAYWQERQEYALGVLCSQDHALLGGAYYAAHRLIAKRDSRVSLIQLARGRSHIRLV